jgi:hypothetical protein
VDSAAVALPLATKDAAMQRIAKIRKYNLLSSYDFYFASLKKGFAD